MRSPRSTIQSPTAHSGIDVWENEGGAPAASDMDGQFGRRIEADRSWTVYHVFTGVPATSGDRSLIGLSRVDATSRMMTLNSLNVTDRRERLRHFPKTGIINIEKLRG